MKFCTFLMLVFSLVTTSASVSAAERPTLTFAIDNDAIFGVDQDYSNGIFSAYTSGKISTPSILYFLSLSVWDIPALDKVEFTLGHKIWTPSDIKAEKPVVNDRPYAGYFYTEFNFISLNHQQVQRFNLTIGTTGNNSFADQAQKIIHHMTGSNEPNGWEYQIDDEIVGSIGYLTHFNLNRNTLFNNSESTSSEPENLKSKSPGANTASENTEFEISNITEVNIGRFRSDIATGIMWRWGTDLGGNIGAANISTEQPFYPGMIGASNSAWFIFTGIEGRYRFNDITIEGERQNITAPDNYPSTLEHWQSSAVFGVAWYRKHVGLSITFAAKTPDYEEAQTSLYGTAALSLFAFL